MLSPDLYLQYFDEVCERYTRNGNALFIPETRASAANALLAFGKYGAIGYSPFGIERGVGADTDLSATYRLIAQMAPVIAAHQGTGVDYGHCCSGRATHRGRCDWATIP